MSTKKEPVFYLDCEKCDVTYNKEENTVCVDLLLQQVDNTSKKKRFIRTRYVREWLEKEWIPSKHSELKIIKCIQTCTSANHCSKDNLKGCWIYEVESTVEVKKSIPKLKPKTTIPKPKPKTKYKV